MKQLFRRLVTFTLVVMLLLGCTATAFAAESTVTWQGQKKGFGFAPGSEYTATDLFGSLKDIMPGDERTQTITLENAATDSDYVRFYLRAVPHGSGNLPQADAEDETVATMQEFLSQLTMRVYNGKTLIFDATADQTASLTENVFLAQLASGDRLTLTVELEVPITMDNRYAGRIGEVDWVFTAQQLGEPKTLTVKKVWVDNGQNRPASVTVALYNGETQVETVTLSDDNNWTHTWQELDSLGNWSVKELNVPSGYQASYQVRGETITITNTRTGTDPGPGPGPGPGTDPDPGPGTGTEPGPGTEPGTKPGSNPGSLIQTGQLNWPIPVLAGMGMILLIVGLILFFRKRKRGCEE